MQGKFKLPNPTKSHFILTQTIYHCITVSFGERKKNSQGSSWESNPGPFRSLECPTSNPESPGFDSQLDLCGFFFLSPKLTSSCFCLHRTFTLHYCVSPPSPCFFLLPPLSANFTISGSVPPTATQMQNVLLWSSQLATQASARYENTTYNHQSAKTNTGPLRVYGICMHACVHTC